MSESRYSYDETSDILHIVFAPGEQATGIELTDHILLRYKKQERRIVSITLLDYSLLTQATEIGQKGFPLTGLDDVSQETRDTVLALLKQAPATDVLTLLAYTPSHHEYIPIVAINTLAVGSVTVA